MSKQPATPSQMAERLAALLPPALSPALLEDYRLEHVVPHAPQLTHELLGLSLFYITAALEAHYRGIGDVLVSPEVRRLLFQRWTKVYGLPEPDWEGFLHDLPERFRLYERVNAEGGSAVSVATEVAADLESNWVIRSEDEPQALALLVDLVQVDAIGDLFETLELVAPS